MTTEAVVTVRDPALVTVRPYGPHEERAFLPAGRGPAAMLAVDGKHGDLWLVRAKDAAILASRDPEPDPGPFRPDEPVLTSDGELRLGEDYVAAVTRAPSRRRPDVPLVKGLTLQTLTDLKTETTRYHYNDRDVEETKTTIETEVARDTVVFETPRSNVRAISKRIRPNRATGWLYVVMGATFTVGSILIARMADDGLSERNRVTAYRLAGATACVSLPLLGLGSYMVLAPETAEPLWSSSVR